MLELPEVMARAKELNKSIVGKEVAYVLPPTKPHKFCWFQGNPEDYEDKILGSKVQETTGFGIYVEVVFDNGYKLSVNDGVNMLYTDKAAKNYQLTIGFTDDTMLVLSVAMYGGIILHSGDYDNEYYMKSKYALSPFDDEFPAYFDKLIQESKPSLSAKALLATEQRIPGIGNGCAQDILFTAGIHPKRKVVTFKDEEKENLLNSIRSVLKDMIEKGGRDTEKRIDGQAGGYQTLMSKNSIINGCPYCGQPITKENFLGGSIYYCSFCQPMD